MQLSKTLKHAMFNTQKPNVFTHNRYDTRIFMRSPDHKGRWRGLDEDVSDDQQDITRGRNMVESLYQGFQGTDGTHNAIMNSTEYLTSNKRSFSNVEDGFYISPEFLDKMTVHIAKKFYGVAKD